VLERLTDDKDLQAVVAGIYGMYGVEPHRVPFVVHTSSLPTMWQGGGSFESPRGGPTVLPQKKTQTIGAHGGKVQTGVAAKQILIDPKANNQVTGVELDDGSIISSSRVFPKWAWSLCFPSCFILLIPLLVKRRPLTRWMWLDMRLYN